MLFINLEIYAGDRPLSSIPQLEEAVPFTHPAIEEIILFLFFPPAEASRKKMGTRLAVVEPEAFQPLDTATIALACTLVAPRFFG